jgi:hypothetical protein
MDLDIMDKVMEICGMGLWEGQTEDLAQEDGTVSPISLSPTGSTKRQYRHSRPSHTTLPCLLCFPSPGQLRDELY